MASKINISIPEPCHENWQKMTPTEKGRFCDSCEKNVFDFTKASDRQIINAYNKNPNLCGRFLNTQLERDLIAPKEKSSIWMATTSAVISFLAFGNHEINAQEKVKMEQTDQKDSLEKPLQNSNNTEKEITGIVSDESGPLPGVNVVIKGTQRGVQTDVGGAFKINVKEGETLVFSFMGMSDFEVQIAKTLNYEIKMNVGLVTQGLMIYTRNRTFLGRTFHRIGNLFR